MRILNCVTNARVLKNRLALERVINLQFTLWRRSFTTRFIESAVSNHMPNLVWAFSIMIGDNAEEPYFVFESNSVCPFPLVQLLLALPGMFSNCAILRISWVYSDWVEIISKNDLCEPGILNLRLHILKMCPKVWDRERSPGIFGSIRHIRQISLRAFNHDTDK